MDTPGYTRIRYLYKLIEKYERLNDEIQISKDNCGTSYTDEIPCVSFLACNGPESRNIEIRGQTFTLDQVNDLANIVTARILELHAQIKELYQKID